ncbi:alpha-tocopherol transfer protein-like isoform X3 [Homo sapiens]|uniref:alpha-tocopherol transfer protein-like isoform X3 n=1 Tax=Homo sapiens TaxID=9606 RepID=UPI000387AE91|nr:alpha-tocopherol transfer protein-like isoform X3 [Homo sapiens]XP_047296447.1 alpha-tocopherol transfer protein-like isoform X3 [Homo sapiens]XP_047296448.1 alpha-tocopherol transfer protein-like isoform X3 [Homo sapiens]XP_047296449.1 alpha-tocopherol transfer protein-like isoform X3 [Homo sapiens]XP_047296450.1 alpha-tocopherol transfer protein-like isoform X3 [Homo sapiens]XP_054179980.1 alpha-tocopherol transfer protein-like isoform X3 [Homo sapiens]XP_054179981.1 alpha-tocopherol tra|eukprot:XP_011527347.1 alpha-tocopherol transfer protein-like isoform X3 [Homo sapiens]
MSEESDSLRTSPSVASLSENELPPPPEPPGYVCSLTEDLVTKAREELQEKPEWRLRDVQALRDMVRKEYPNLSTSLDDAFLLRFLRARKFDYDRALQLLVNYHSCRRSWPEVFNNLKPSALKDVLASGFLTVLPHTDPRGCHVVCIRPDRWIPSNYPITENIRAIYLTLEKLIQSEETQVNGIVILADYKGVSLSKASHFGPFIAKKVIGILQFFLHGSDLNSLHTNLPRSILPKEYGGTAGELDTATWNAVLLASEDDFVKEFCQPVPACDSILGQTLLPEGLTSDAQCDDSLRAVKSQLYSCY